MGSITSGHCMRGLYAIVDVATLAAHHLEPIAFTEAVLSARPAAIQLRSKDASPRDTLALLRQLAPMCHRVSVPLVANDRPDWAVLAGCDMVHIGQDDMPIDRVRRLAPGVGVGVSTHTLEQLNAALAARPEYVAFGPVFETPSKKNPDPVVGVAGLAEASRFASAAGVPLVAIGGITRERARSLVGLTDAIAVIGALFPPSPAVHGDDGRPTKDVLAEIAAQAQALQVLFSPGGAEAEARR